jgi:hypothetical protein
MRASLITTGALPPPQAVSVPAAVLQASSQITLQQSGTTLHTASQQARLKQCALLWGWKQSPASASPQLNTRGRLQLALTAPGVS